MIKDKQDDEINVFISKLVKYLISDQASVMVGAGFSSNADYEEGVASIPTWNGLGDKFYEKLYGELPKDKTYLDVLKLAEEVESNYNRQELERMIGEAIPYEKLRPSELHYKLLQLPWMDIFTTNYDTLLEEAKRKSDIDFETIKTDARLHLSKKHRIIKLHGCLSAQRDYVITQEDYRKYEQNHAILANTVKQALIENFFCFIGFSGDDPNFLNWYGWVKDNFKNKDNKIEIYFIGLNFSVSEKKYLNHNNIIPIDLASFCKVTDEKNITELSQNVIIQPKSYIYKEAYKGFLDTVIEEYQKAKKTDRVYDSTIKDFLDSTENKNTSKEKSEAIDNFASEDSVQNTKTNKLIIVDEMPNWPNEELSYLYPEKDLVPQYKEILEKWKKIRKNYPGWLVLSENRRKELERNTDASFVYHIDEIEDFLDIQILYEFNWRIEKYFHPLYNNWENIYKTVVEKYNPFPELLEVEKSIIPMKDDGIDWGHLRYCWIELQFALLKFYREEDMDNEWSVVAKRIEEIKEFLTDEQTAKYHYERCLFQLFYMDILAIRRELSNWEVNNNFPYWKAKRAGLIAELGGVSEALSIIEASLEIIKEKIESTKITKNYQLASQNAYMLVLFDYVKRTDNFNKSDWSFKYKGRDEIVQQIESLKRYECDPWGDLQYYETLLKLNAPDFKQIEIRYGFELGSTFRTRHFGSGDTYTMLAYSFLSYMEQIGFPFKLPGITFGEDAARKVMQRLREFSPIWALVTCVRVGDEKNVESILDRRIITKTSNEYADELAKSLLKILKNSKNEIHQGDRYLKNFGISISTV
jgi:NAD-dependent SIR2 family protein deacetylase